jgi:hypothetical protein
MYCHVRLIDRVARRGDYAGRWVACGTAASPEFALAEFERHLAQITGKVLDDITFKVEPQEDIDHFANKGG